MLPGCKQLSNKCAKCNCTCLCSSAYMSFCRQPQDSSLQSVASCADEIDRRPEVILAAHHVLCASACSSASALHAECGILRSSDFAGLAWEHEAPPAEASDVLRVHEWTYVRHLKSYCEQLLDDPAVVGELDPDTGLGRESFDVALVAAGAACQAVDRVVAGKVWAPGWSGSWDEAMSGWCHD